MSKEKKKQQINPPAARSRKSSSASKDPSLATLRRKAEKKLKEQTKRLEELSREDLKTLVHNLGTYQIELEMQNEELRRTRQEVEASQKQYAELYDFAPVGYFTFDENCVVLEANLTGAGMLGVERTKLLKTPFILFVSKKERNTFNLHCQKVLSTGEKQTCELELARKDGTLFFAAIESVSAGGKTFRTAINDISKRKSAEAALKDSEGRYRSIFDRANDGIIAYDLKTEKFLFLNKSMSELTGYSGKEMLKLSVKDLHPEKDLPFVLKEFSALASGEKTDAKDIPVLRKDGSIKYCDVGSSFIGKTTLLGFFRDVTDLKVAEDRIKHLASFPQLNPNPVIEADTSGKVTFCNPATQNILESLGLDKGDSAVFLPADFDRIIKELGGKEEVSLYREVVVKDRVFAETIYLSSRFGVVRIYAFEITDRRKMEDAIIESEERLRFALETSHTGAWDLDLVDHTSITSIEYDRVFGYSEVLPQWTYEKFLEHILPEDREAVDSMFRQATLTQSDWAFECRIRRTDGEVRWIWSAGRHRPDAAGAFRRMVGIVQDITERKQAEEVLRQAHYELELRVRERTRELEEANITINTEKQRFYDVLEMLPTYVVLLTPDHYVTFANRFFRERFGDSGGRHCYEYLFERTEPCQICETFNVLKTKAPHHWEWAGPDSRSYDIFDFPFKDADGSPLIMEVGIDITELKQAEKSLREINESLEERIAQRTAELESANAQLIESRSTAFCMMEDAIAAKEALMRSQEDMNRAQEVGSIGSWRLDVRQNIFAWSDENHLIFGVPKGSPLTYETFLSAVHPDDRVYVDEKWKAGLAGDTFDIEHRIVVDGRVKWVRDKAYIEFDEKGKLLGALGITQDITERKLSEEALVKSESKFRSLFTNMINGFALQKIITDASGRPVDYIFMEVNPAFETITGLKEEEVIGRRVTEVLPGFENDPAGWIEIYGKVALTREECRFEQYSRRLDRWFSICAYSPMQGFFVCIFEDITPRKRMEKELVRAKDELELRVKERTEELFEKSRVLESFFKHTRTCLVFLDRNFNFIRVNEAYAKACSRPVTDFKGHNHFADYPSEELREKFQQVVETRQPYSAIKRPFTFPDHPEWGTTYWDLTVAPVLDSAGEVDFLVYSLADVTDEMQAEAQIFHLNRMYGMLSKVNSSILRIREPNELYKQLCLIAVEEGLFRMAWIGLVDPDTKKVVPACSYGDRGGYLDSISIYAADVPEGIGPTGRAIREGRNMICSDIEYDPIMLPWKDSALKHGFHSSASIPLRLGERVIGAFTIYAGTPLFFTDEELALLTSLADNISFAIDAMSNEKMRLEAEMTLRRSAEEIQDLYNNAPCGYHVLDKDGTIVRINDTELKWLGFKREEIVGKRKIYEFYTPESVETFKTRYPAFVESGSVAEVEVDILRDDGSILSFFIKSTAIRDKDGNFLVCRSTVFDITDKKEAEQRIRATNELLKLFTQKYSLREYLDAVSELLRKWSGCTHVGFRIKDENGTIPFLASINYDPAFLKREGTLSLVDEQCICTRVIAGRPEPSDLVCMTQGGSFISGNTTSFTEALSGEQKSKYRSVCMQAGFRSLAVVPLRYLDQTLGAIHIADEREGVITFKKIEFIEQLAVMVGEAFNRFSAKEELRKSREELRNLNKYLREVRENERTTIAREIHDELGQIITALRLDLAWIRDQYREDQVIYDKSRSMLALVDATIQTVQNIIAELRPGILDVLGLFAAIEWQAEELKKMGGINCDLRLPSEDIQVSPEVSTNIFRIVQELFTNIVRYSQASNVSVQIEIKDDQLFLNVSDNGIGIRPQNISSPVSFGIIGIRERVYAMKGEMHISGTAGVGTVVTITVPVKAGQST